MKIDPESRALDGASTLLAFIALNIVYLVCCVPVVTIGVATSALFEVTRRYSDEESGRLLKDYFIALRENLWRATAIYATLVAPFLVLAFSGVFWLSHDSVIAGGAAILSFLGAGYVFAAFLYGMALVASFRSTYRQTLKNALLLPMAEPVRTILILVIPVTCVALAVVFPAFLFLIVTVGFSVGSYASAFIFRNVFARHGA